MPNSNINHIAIPEISDEALRQRADKIKALVHQDGALHFIQEPNLRETAFMWDPILTDKAPKMREVARITTYHTFGHPALFKPSIAEVLAQIPEDVVDKVSAFKVLGPDDVDDLNNENEALNAGYHVAVTILYA